MQIPIIPDSTYEVCFNINLYLPQVRFISMQTNFNNNVINEHWEIKPTDLIVPIKSTASFGAIVKNTLLPIVQTEMLPLTQNIINQYNNKYNYYYTLHNLYTGDTGVKNGEASVSFYLPITCNIKTINCSDKVCKSLGNFRIRIANHISPPEQLSIKNYNNIKLYSQQISGLNKKLFIEYTNNIFEAYTKFLQHLEVYSDYIESFDNINKNDINIVKKVAIQGTFNDVEDILNLFKDK